MMPRIPTLTIPPGYRAQAEDTSLEADALEFALLRDRPPQERWAIATTLMKRTRQLSLRCLKQRFHDLPQTELARKVAQAWLQEDCPIDFIPGCDETMWIQDPLEIAVLLHSLLESMRIEYFITGGSAAILYGEPRTTRDLDLVLAIQLAQVDAIVVQLEASGFYVAGVEDVKAGQMQTFQVIHAETIARADLMLAGTTPFDVTQFQRRQEMTMDDGQVLYYASPEDVVLSKLRWRQQSQSDKQWRDVLGILKVQGNRLEQDYLQQWASQLGVMSDLREAWQQAGQSIS